LLLDVRSRNPYLFPVGKSRYEPLSIIIFAALMGAASLQLIVQVRGGEAGGAGANGGEGGTLARHSSAARSLSPARFPAPPPPPAPAPQGVTDLTKGFSEGAPTQIASTVTYAVLATIIGGEWWEWQECGSARRGLWCLFGKMHNARVRGGKSDVSGERSRLVPTRCLPTVPRTSSTSSRRPTAVKFLLLLFCNAIKKWSTSVGALALDHLADILTNGVVRGRARTGQRGCGVARGRGALLRALSAGF
jgi:hypothetical protein